MVLGLVHTLPQRDELRYIIAMDNFFTVPSVISAMRMEGVGCIGTARARRGWPPSEYKRVTDDRFNSLYLLNDQKNFLIARWVDNNVVTMVSTVHTGKEEIMRLRRRPRKTKQNKAHVDLVWGQEPVKEIHIPGLIDDYNHWMLGVDKSDQLIAYYRPEVRCQRIWMPIFFHCLDLIRVNAFIIWRKLTNVQGMLGEHKIFIVEFIKALLGRASSVEYGKTRAARQASKALSSPTRFKRTRMTKFLPELPRERMNGSLEDHVVGIDSGNMQRICQYCAYLRAISKERGDVTIPKTRRVTRMCISCNVHLCKAHFNVYHGRSSVSV